MHYKPVCYKRLLTYLFTYSFIHCSNFKAEISCSINSKFSKPSEQAYILFSSPYIKHNSGHSAASLCASSTDLCLTKYKKTNKKKQTRYKTLHIYLKRRHFYWQVNLDIKNSHRPMRVVYTPFAISFTIAIKKIHSKYWLILEIISCEKCNKGVTNT